MSVIFQNVHNLLLTVNIAEDYLSLEIDVWLQPCNAVKRYPSFFSEIGDN